MRIAAAIMLMAIGVFSLDYTSISFSRLISSVAGSGSSGAYSVVGVALTVVVVGLMVAGGILALRKKAYWWVFSAALCAVATGFLRMFWTPFPLPPFHPLAGQPGIGFSYTTAYINVGVTLLACLAVVFLVRRRGEFRS